MRVFPSLVALLLTSTAAALDQQTVRDQQCAVTGGCPERPEPRRLVVYPEPEMDHSQHAAPPRGNETAPAPPSSAVQDAAGGVGARLAGSIRGNPVPAAAGAQLAADEIPLEQARAQMLVSAQQVAGGVRYTPLRIAAFDTVENLTRAARARGATALDAGDVRGFSQMLAAQVEYSQSQWRISRDRSLTPAQAQARMAEAQAEFDRSMRPLMSAAIMGDFHRSFDQAFERARARDRRRDDPPERPVPPRHYDDMISNDPRSASNWALRAGERLATGDLRGALSDANRAVALGGGADALAARAGINAAMGDYAAAQKDAQAALAEDPNNATAFQALKMTEGRVGAEGAHAGHHAHGGGGAQTRGFMGGGDAGAARVSFAAAARDPGRLAAARYNEQAERALRLRDFTSAIDHTARALDADASNAHARYLRSTAFARQRKWQEAEEEAEKAAALEPQSWQYATARAYAQARGKKYRDALASSNRALELNPENAWAFGTRALAQRGLGDRDAMAADLRRARELNPAFASALDQALQKPEDQDLFFLFPGETASGKEGPAAEGGRKRRFGVLAGAAGVGGLLLALGLLSAVLGPVREALTSAFTRGRSPSVSPLGSEALSPAPRSGLLRGQYELGRQIGAGGMGLVYEGTDRSLGRRVAIKRMRDEIRLDPRERARFVAEAKTVAGLHHPNIVDIYAVVEEADDLHLVFEFVEGRTLHELISLKGRLTPPDAARVVRGAAEALDFAHGRGVIHRDMKPSNLMLDGAGRVKVMDFGIARAAKDAMTRVSMTNTVVGTPPYMAPEQEQGQVRKESDVYALAICAYELIVGKLPFPGISAGMLMNKINMSYVPPSKMSEGLPPALDEVFHKAFQPDPDKRYRRAGELAAALDAALASPARA